MDKFRARNFNLVLYDEDETHRRALEYIEKNCDYAKILHDRDVNPDTGEIKKPHYHVVIRFQNAKWNTSLASDLGIGENYIEESRNLKRSLLYLIHYYDEDKFQYSVEDVEGSLKKRLLEIIKNDDKTESEKVIELLNYIDDCDYEIDLSAFIRYVASIGYWDIFRRSPYVFEKYIIKHNDNL